MGISDIYNLLPRSIQNLALSGYGAYQYRLRYQQILPELYAGAELHFDRPAQQVQAFQAKRFAELVKHAVEHVPYYRDLFARLAIDPSRITLENFRDYIPVLSKSEIVAEPYRFHSEFYKAHKDKALSLFTSGTSGSPMPISCTKEARAINYAFYRSLLKKYGGDIRERSATFAGRVLLNKSEKSEFWRKDYFNRTLYLSSYHITEATIPVYIEALEKWRPIYIDSYPSAISLIADYINRHALKINLPLKFILTSSETLTESQRDSIERAFGCPLVDHYGCSEMAVSASGDRAGLYRIDSLYSLVEFLPAELPGSYEVVCTGLLNFAMPLLRYNIGDVVDDVQLASENPFYGQRFGQVVGRQDDIIVTPEGRKIGRMDPAFKGMSGIRQAQIVQTDIDSLEVLVVLAESADTAYIEVELARNIRQRTSSVMKVSIRFVDKIPTNKAGKFKSVVSRLSPVLQAI